LWCYLLTNAQLKSNTRSFAKKKKKLYFTTQISLFSKKDRIRHLGNSNFNKKLKNYYRGNELLAFQNNSYLLF
jgi:hypothetical protein